MSYFSTILTTSIINNILKVIFYKREFRYRAFYRVWERTYDNNNIFSKKQRAREIG